MIFSHIYKSWKHHASLQLATLVVLSTSLTLVISMFVVNANLEKIITLWGKNIQMTVYIKPEANIEHVVQIESFLFGNSNFETVKKISKEEALDQFRSQFQHYAADLLNDKDMLSLIPMSFQFNLITQLNENVLQKISEVSDQVKSFAAVEEISFGQDWIKNYSSFSDGVQKMTLGISITIILAALFAISNSIRASVDQRKDDVAILELIGATSSFIRRPYIWEGVIFSLISTWIAIAVTAIIFGLSKSFLLAQPVFSHLASHLEFMSFQAMALTSLLGALLGYFVTFLHVKRINTGWLGAGMQKAK